MRVFRPFLSPANQSMRGVYQAAGRDAMSSFVLFFLKGVFMIEKIFFLNSGNFLGIFSGSH